jgi:hypothetical protein
MASSNRFDFAVMAGAEYVLDAAVLPNHFYMDEKHVFHIGAGTEDLQACLFWLNLTLKDREWLRAMHIGFE